MARQQADFQVALIGGGIHGAALAREFAAQGYRVFLGEQGDWAQATSCQSSKLIHGGIRYLEQGRLSLVRESLLERKRLLQNAPHLVKPLSIHIPIYKGASRPWWMVRFGCLLYDLLAGKANFEPSSSIPVETASRTMGLNPDGLKGIIRYQDAQSFDSRLVVETVLSARTLGAKAQNYCQLTGAEFKGGLWRLRFWDHRAHKGFDLSTRFLINTAGPWAKDLASLCGMDSRNMDYTMVRGIHLVTKNRIGKRGFLVQPEDNRVVFVLPWQEKYQLIGTTETLYQGQERVKIPASSQEKAYLVQAYNHYFPGHRLSLDQSLFTYSGVRVIPKVKGQAFSSASREYHLEFKSLEQGTGYAAVLGGKLTTHRSLAERIVAKVQKKLAPDEAPKADTKQMPLYGAMAWDKRQQTLAKRIQEKGWEPSLLEDWQSRYGSKWVDLAEAALEDESLIEPVARDLSRAELDYMLKVEDAVRIDDLLVRRSFRRPDFSAGDVERLKRILDEV